jgi:lambda repressor-like predicted transcriptional regulator
MTNAGVESVSTKGTYECHIDDVLDEQGRMKKWLCKEAGINPGWLTKLADGESLPNVHHAQRIANALGVEISVLWPLPKKDGKSK